MSPSTSRSLHARSSTSSKRFLSTFIRRHSRSVHAQCLFKAFSNPGSSDDNDDGEGDDKYSGPKATLDATTTWVMRTKMKDDESANATRVVFDCDEGYEPPQGVVRTVDDGTELGRWLLCEDPDAKSENPLDGGGLWIFGLFDEPLYPFLVFTYVDDAGVELRAKVPHGRGKRRGTVLDGGFLTRKVTANVNADQFGMSRVDVVVRREGVGEVHLKPVDRY
ncbi:hypothetical protein RI054_09g48220 [Pseudoscourfieldia marina]